MTAHSSARDGLHNSQKVVPLLPETFTRLDPTTQRTRLLELAGLNTSELQTQCGRGDRGIQVTPREDGSWEHAGKVALTRSNSFIVAEQLPDSKTNYSLHSTFNGAVLNFSNRIFPNGTGHLNAPENFDTPKSRLLMFFSAEKFVAVFQATLPADEIKMLLAESHLKMRP